ncbi:MAG: hypothetical protein B6D64_11825 [Bacteroidetes bacterium 4484_276]|nr:MAG: hypothetical protein B6D64_11825 [Bacteroidetes bacterium 4484_276]OYT12377.1 MAG: hypothetical protein B6I19_09875 [Bacteroidetes bacterium 4572_114]
MARTSITIDELSNAEVIEQDTKTKDGATAAYRTK